MQQEKGIDSLGRMSVSVTAWKYEVLQGICKRRGISPDRLINEFLDLEEKYAGGCPWKQK